MQTPHLKAPLLAAGQAQKHVTLNEALLTLDDIVHLSVETASLSAPPNTPQEATRYLVAEGAAGLWSGYSGRIAAFRDGGWVFHAPATGWAAYVMDTKQVLIFDGTDWQATRRLGINATADDTNRLALASEASLFNHAGNGHQLKINKAQPTDTASILFQTGFGGRAEVGTTGSNALSFKVSADGATWRTALRIDENNALVDLPTNPGALARPNLAINGDFSINQREFPGGVLAANKYGYDRWRAGSGGANVSVSSGVVTLASGQLIQTIEAAQWGLSSFADAEVTISVESPSLALTVALADVSGSIAAGPGRRQVMLTLPPSAGGQIQLAISAAASCSFSRIKIELGRGQTPWTPRPRSAEESMAYRYYYQLKGPIHVFLNAQGFGNYTFDHVTLPVSMRATPTVTRTVLAAGNLFQGDQNFAVASALNANLLQFYVRANAGGECYATFGKVECDAEFYS